MFTAGTLSTIRIVYHRTEERAAGWFRLTREVLKLPEAPSVSSKEGNAQAKDSIPPKPKSDKPAPRPRRPQPLIKLVMRRCILFNFICFLPCNDLILLGCKLAFAVLICIFFTLLDLKARSGVSLVLCFMQQRGLLWRWEKAGLQHML